MQNYNDQHASNNITMSMKVNLRLVLQTLNETGQ